MSNIVYSLQEKSGISKDNFSPIHDDIINLLKKPNTDFAIEIDTTEGDGLNTISLPIQSDSSLTINWGDGNVETVSQTLLPTPLNAISHTYASAGVYVIKISRELKRVYFNDVGDKLKITKIINWGRCVWTSFDSAFKGCANLIQIDTASVPDLTSVTSLQSMFEGASSFNSNLARWNVSNIVLAISAFASSGMSCANYTDTIVGWINLAISTGSPLNLDLTLQTGMTFNTSRSGGFDFSTSGEARVKALDSVIDLGLGFSISGDTVQNSC